MTICSLLRLRGNNHFDVERDVDVVADDHATAVEFLVPGDAEVLAVDLRGSGYGGALQAPGILDGSLGQGCGQGRGFGDAANGQVAGNFQVAVIAAFDPGGLKGDGRILGDV